MVYCFKVKTLTIYSFVFTVMPITLVTKQDDRQLAIIYWSELALLAGAPKDNQPYLSLNTLQRHRHHVNWYGIRIC